MTRERERVKVLLAVTRTPMSTVEIANRAGLRCEDARSALESLRRMGLVGWTDTAQARHVITRRGEYVAGLVKAGQS